MATAKHYAHFTLEDRKEIENGIIENKSLAEIGRKIDKDATSISREIKRNRRCDGRSQSPCLKNQCVHRKTCKLRHLCGDKKCRKKCSVCAARCRHGACEYFEPEVCKRTSKAPWVCNGCEKRSHCPLEKYSYSAKLAQSHADDRLVDTRIGLDMNGHEIAYLETTLRQGLKLGQSVHHIFVSHKDLPCSERSFYRHVENESIDIKKMELSKKVKYKKRNKKKKHNSTYYTGRTYSDYLLLSEEDRLNAVQMDCVEGTEEDKSTILSIHFVNLHFQIYFRLEKKDSKHVVEVIDGLEDLLGKETFKKFFYLILCDRGSEFDNFEGLEKEGRCSVYYTDPQRPDQKGSCEKNHVELRKIIPKGTSLDKLKLNPWLMAEICSHVNSSIRLSIGNATPLKLAYLALPKELLEGLGLEEIPPDQVELNPSLIERLKNNKNK